MATARTGMPELIKEVKRLRKEVEKLRETQKGAT